jgi:hypothetical protein
MCMLAVRGLRAQQLDQSVLTACPEPVNVAAAMSKLNH